MAGFDGQVLHFQLFCSPMVNLTFGPYQRFLVFGSHHARLGAVSYLQSGVQKEVKSVPVQLRVELRLTGQLLVNDGQMASFWYIL